MSYQTLTLERRDGVATLTLNRPDAYNALNLELGRELFHAVLELDEDPAVRCVVVTGAGKAFCAGGDVKDFADNLPRIGVLVKELTTYLHGAVSRLCRSDKPVIAMVNGLAVGAGMGMCVMCDMRVAAESARFSTGYVRVGLVPGDGDTYFLPRLVGAAKALELLWTADFIEAPEAHRLGIVQRLAPDAQLKDVTYALARQIADGPQIPVRMIKRLVYQSLRLDLRTHLDLVSSHMSIVRQTADHAEGVAAFKEKRPPKFQGR